VGLRFNLPRARWVYATGAVGRIKLRSTFAGAAAILLKDQEEGGYATAQGGQVLQNLLIDGSAYTATQAHGIQATGLVKGVKIDNMTARYMSGDGIRTAGYTRTDTNVYYPRGWQITHAVAETCARYGFNLQLLNDSDIEDLLAVGCVDNGFQMVGMGETHFDNSRAVFNGGHGFYITGATYGAVSIGSLTTDRNAKSGVTIDATGAYPINIGLLNLRRDGSDNTGRAALSFAGAGCPVNIGQVSTATGVEDDGSGARTPKYGIATAGARAVTVGSAYLWGVTAAISDTDSGATTLRIGKVVKATGTAASPTYAVPDTFPRGGHPAARAFDGVRSILQRGQRSTCIQWVGDSTGDSTGEIVDVFTRRLAVDYPAYTVWTQLWDDTLQRYLSPSELQLGAAGERYALLDGTNSALVTSAAGFAGDLDVRAKLRPTTWATSGTTQQTIASHYVSTTNHRGWSFDLRTDGKLDFVYSTDGTSGTAVTLVSSAVVPFTNGTDGWVRAVHDVDNGAAGNTVTFYTSTDGTTWTTLGSAQVTAGVVARYVPTDTMAVGARGTSASASNFFPGRVYRIEIRNGIDGAAVAPILPDIWVRVGGTASLTFSGAPILLVRNACVSGKSIVGYHADSTRLPKELAPQGQRLLIVNTGHNETASTWVADLAAYITSARAQLGTLVPWLFVGQNPTVQGGTYTADQQSVQYRAQIGADGLAYAAANGGYGVDLWPEFTDLATQLNADGLHPATGADLGSEMAGIALHRALCL
jgi:hypothetical protein